MEVKPSNLMRPFDSFSILPIHGTITRLQTLDVAGTKVWNRKVVTF